MGSVVEEVPRDCSVYRADDRPDGPRADAVEAEQRCNEELPRWGCDDDSGGHERAFGTQHTLLRASVADRPAHQLPADLRDGPTGPHFDALPFTSLYLLENEWAAEIANRTMHGVMHLGWVPDQMGGYRGRMAVLVKPNGLLGNAYMAAIKPFRHLIVYPPMLRQIEQTWQRAADEPTPAHA